MDNSPNVVLSLLVLLQLGGVLTFVLATLYVLYCLNRAASGLERMADTAEAWLALQHYQAAQSAKRDEQNAQTPPSQTPPVETVRLAPLQEPPSGAPQNL